MYWTSDPSTIEYWPSGATQVNPIKPMRKLAFSDARKKRKGEDIIMYSSRSKFLSYLWLKVDEMFKLVFKVLVKMV